MTVFYYAHDLPDTKLANAKALAIDTETLGLNLLRDRLCVVQLSTGDGDAHLVHFPTANYDAPNLKKVLKSAKTHIFHYARFDVAALQHYLDVKSPDIYCTKIASKLARTYTDRHGLKELCRELLDIELDKQQQSSYWGEEALTCAQKHYAASDVLYLHQLRDKLNVYLERENRQHHLQACLDFLPTRVALDLLGWDIDIFHH